MEITASPRQRHHHGGGQSRSRGPVGFLVFMELGSGMLQGWYTVLLTAIGAALTVSSDRLNWITAGNLLATVVLVPVIGTLGDRFGHKRLLAISAASVTVGTALVAAAPSFELLMVGRVLQAPLAAFLPLEFAIVRSRDQVNAGRSVGRLVGALTLGAALGAVTAGVLMSATDDLRLVLWLPVAFLALCLVLMLRLVPETTVRSAGRVDWAGAALLGSGLLLLLVGVSNAARWGWTSPSLVTCLVLGALLLAAWVRVERRVTHPLIDLATLTRGGLGLPYCLAALLGAELFGSQVAGSLYMLSDPETHGVGLGLSPAAVGGLSLVMALAAFAGAASAHRMATRRSPRAVLAIGGLMVTASFSAMVVVHESVTGVAVASVVGGLGTGLLMATLPAVVVRRAPADRVGVASALYNTSRTGAGALAGALFALVMSAFLVTPPGSTTPVTSTAGYLAVWGTCAVICLAFTVLALRLGNSAATAADETLVVTDLAPPASAPATPVPVSAPRSSA